jgi:molybdopterin converting factor small subunit
VATLRLFASAREAAGRTSDQIAGDTVDAILAEATARYGQAFAALLPSCKVWVNGEPAGPTTPVETGDEVAVLPPVSGG